ncbi:hypothetical protein ACQP1G_11720 [Nocardia sp. CA-107356]|uniref:hypothetical protein n=1 Tax=Nocardia sp. CA-107356 TaxID=3239972 RepID=UPI003D8C726D
MARNTGAFDLPNQLHQSDFEHLRALDSCRRRSKTGRDSLPISVGRDRVEAYVRVDPIDAHDGGIPIEVREYVRDVGWIGAEP